MLWWLTGTRDLACLVFRKALINLTSAFLEIFILLWQSVINTSPRDGLVQCVGVCVCGGGGAHLVLWNCYSNHHPRHLLVRLVTKAFQAEPFTAEFCVTGWCFTFSAEGDFYQLISLLMRWRICCIWRLTRRGTSCPRCRGSAETVGTKFESGGCGYFWG